MSDVGNIVGNLVRTVAGVVTGGTSERVIELAEGILGDPDTRGFSSEQRHALLMAQKQAETEQVRAVYDAASTAERNLTERISLLEGTSRDLLAGGPFGRLVLFLRGLQRPTWGFAVIGLDYFVFSGQWALPDGPVASAFWIVNALVLGFLFGERALKNVLPLLGPFLQRGKE